MIVGMVDGVVSKCGRRLRGFEVYRKKMGEVSKVECRDRRKCSCFTHTFTKKIIHQKPTTQNNNNVA